MTDATFGNLADDTAKTTEAVPLSAFLSDLTTYRTPGEAGGVPVPESWACFRAALGGARRDHLEDAHAARFGGARENDARDALAHVEALANEGTHLPAGLHIVTGQTGGGKSALVVNLARAAADAGHPVLYVTLELDGDEIAARLVGLVSGIPWYKLAQRRRLSENDAQRRNDALFDLEQSGAAARIAVLAPNGPFVVERLHREAFDLWRSCRKVPLVIFDYLQLAAVRQGDGYRAPIREAIAAVALELRSLSRRRADVPDWPGCPVVVLSTTARSNVKGEGAAKGMDGKDPDAIRKEDLETLKALPKEAGEVEATAVTAWVLALGDKDTRGLRPLTMRLVKNRLGAPGAWIPFDFNGATGELTEAPDRYSTIERGEDDPSPLAAQLKRAGKR